MFSVLQKVSTEYIGELVITVIPQPHCHILEQGDMDFYTLKAHQMVNTVGEHRRLTKHTNMEFPEQRGSSLHFQREITGHL